MKKYFVKLFEYTDWANKRVIEALKKQSVDDAKIFSLLGHVLAAQFIWLNRIKALSPPPYKLWADYSLQELEAMAGEAGKQWLTYLRETQAENFDRELHYKNYSGDPFVNNVEMIMVHVANHGTYHRAQIAMLMRQKGLEPVNTDFITYDRVISGQLKV